MTASRGGWTIELAENGGDSDQIATIYVRRASQPDDAPSDYFAGTFCKNIADAIRLTQRA